MINLEKKENDIDLERISINSVKNFLIFRFIGLKF